ncbi:hypothetical protein AgCh_024989 [Apium graveolens]
MDKDKRQATPTNVKRGMRQLSFAESVERGKRRKDSKTGKKSNGKEKKKILDAIKANKKKIEMAYKDKSLPEEERIRQMDEVYRKYDKMEINLIEQQDSLIARKNHYHMSRPRNPHLSENAEKWRDEYHETPEKSVQTPDRYAPYENQ